MAFEKGGVRALDHLKSPEITKKKYAISIAVPAMSNLRFTQYCFEDCKSRKKDM